MEDGNLLNILSLILGYTNLIENREQSEYNNIAKHNQVQSQEILEDLHSQFERQNKLLYYQNELLQEILNILKGEQENEL